MQYELNNKTYEIGLSLGCDSLGSLSVSLDDGAVASTTKIAKVLDCIHNNAAVSHFKTCLEGKVELEIPELELKARFPSFYLLR